MKPVWKMYLQYAGLVIVGGILVCIILKGYSASWTGFGNYTSPNNDFVREKTLWDWLELLIIPLVLGIGAYFLNKSERAVERQMAENRTKLEREMISDRQQEAALQSYLDRMAEILLDKKLQTTQNKEVRKVARVRTLTILRGLDGYRKRIVLKFLYEAELITTKKTIVDLTDADLSSADLQGVNLQGVNLKDTNLRDANIQFANLENANLQDAVLKNTNLGGAYLVGANLRSANMEGSSLEGTNLTGAILDGAFLATADLYAAKVSHKQLKKALSLNGATLPDNTEV